VCSAFGGTRARCRNDGGSVGEGNASGSATLDAVSISSRREAFVGHSGPIEGIFPNDPYQ
jgi:hypothetical protein